MADNNNNKYTILISGKLDTTSLVNIQKELDKMKDVSVKITANITQFAVSQTSIDALKAHIENKLGVINVNLAGTGGRSATKTTPSITSSGGGGTFNEEQIRSNSVLLAQYEKIVQKVREATQNAQARITVETNGEGVITRVNALYSDLENKMRNISFLVNDEGELIQEKARYTEDNIKKQKEQLAILEKSKKVIADTKALLRESNPASESVQRAKEMVRNLEASVNQSASTILSGGLLDKEQLAFVDIYTKATKSAKIIQTELNQEISKQQKMLSAGGSQAKNLLEDMKVRSQSIPQVKEAIAQGTELVKVTDEYQKSLDAGIPLTKEQTEAYNQLTASTKVAKTGVGSLGKDTVSWTQEIGVAIKRTIEWSMAMGLVYGSLNQLKQGITFINELDEQLTNVRIVSGATAEQTANLAREYNSLAQELGTTTQEIARGSLEFIRQGKSAAETTELIRISTMQAKLANMDAAQSTEYLTSIMNGFNLEASDMMSVLDKLVNLDNRYATSVAEIAQAMQRSAVSARLAGISLEELASMVTVVSSVSRQSAESIGESFKTIFARMQAVKIGSDTDEEGENISNVEQVLTKYNITLRDSVGEFKDLSDVLDDVASRWETFGSVAKSEIASTIAGVRQRERFLVLLENYDKVKQAEIITTQSAGLALDRYGIYMESVEAKQQKFRATWEELWLNTLNSSVTKTLLDMGTGLLEIGVNLGGLIPLLTTVLGLVVAFNAVTIAGGIADIGAKIAKLVLTLKGATGAVIGLSGALAPIGIILAAIGVAYGTYNAITEAHKKRVEEATTAVDAYIGRVESIPSKLADAGIAVEEINKLFAKFKDGSLTSDDEGELYNQYAILHQLIPEYEGWHHNKKGWYLEEAISIEKVNDLIKAQGNLTEAEKESFKTTIKEKIKDYKKLTNVIEETNIDKRISDMLKDVLNVGASTGKSGNMALYEWWQELVRIPEDALSDAEKRMKEILYSYNNMLVGDLGGDSVSKTFLAMFAIKDGDAEKAINDSEVAAEGFVAGLLETWVNAGDEFRQELISEFGAEHPLIEALNAMLEDNGNAPKANALEEQFKSFKDLLTSIADGMTGETKDAFVSFGESILDLNKSFEDGKISATAYFSTLTEQSANRDLIDMFDDSRESAEGFFVALINNGVTAIDSLTSEFDNGDIAITDYIDGLVSANEMLSNYYQTMIDNADTLELSAEATSQLTAEYAENKAILNETTQELINMSETADLLRQGYDSVMGGDMFAQFQAGAESAIGYFQSLSEAAWNYAQQSGFAFKDTAGNALNSAQEIYGYMSSSIGNFSNFATQMTARVNSGIQAQRTAITDSLTKLAGVISTFKISITPKITNQPVLFEIPKVFQGILGKQSVQFMLPSVSIDATGGLTGDVGSAIGDVVNSLMPLEQPTNYGNEIWSGGGGYTPPSNTGGGGGGQSEEDKARTEAEKAYQDLLKMTIAMLKDKAERAKKALKEELDAYKKLIKAQKDALNLQKKERKDKKEIDDKTKTVTDLQAELAQLQFDTSQEGIARRLELEEQLADATTALEDEQFDQRIEAQEAALDAELELYTEYIEAKIAELDKYLEQEGVIVQEAQALIHGRTQEFYNELMTWNQTYGSGIATDVVDAWKGAITWIDTFAMQGAIAVSSFASSASGAISGISSAISGAIEQASTLASIVASWKDFDWFNLPVYGPLPPTKPTLPTYNFPQNGTYHNGGIVGGLPQIPEQEIFAKLLKGEVVSTKEQGYNFIKSTLPNLIEGSRQTGDIKVDITIPVYGNLDRSVLPDLERAVSKTMMSIRDNAGLQTSSNFNTI